MDIHFSPLRYPGGKSILGKFLSEQIVESDLLGKSYCELYAGGAGAALHLLLNGFVKHIIINDADPRIYAFWFAIVNDTDAFLSKLISVPVTIEEWYVQKSIYNSPKDHSVLEVGFATFFLNRTNRSGVIHNARPIGGLDQSGNYLIDVRFNKLALRHRIEKIAYRRGSIQLFNCQAEDLLNDEEWLSETTKDCFFYLDPPYFGKGQELYLNNYTKDQHKVLANILRTKNLLKWVVSYDNTPEIKAIYSGFRMRTFGLNYSLQEKRKASELMIFSDAIYRIPSSMQIRSHSVKLVETHEQPASI